jgi:ribosome-binding factor A
MKQTPNTRRLNEQAREVVASLLVNEISDPRVEFVTVTGAEVSPDRSVLIVFVSTDPGRYDEVMAGLESAKGRLRSLLGHALGWRVTPELRFYIDESVDSGMRIDEALRAVPPTLVTERTEHAEEPAPSVAADIATDAASVDAPTNAANDVGGE